MTIHFAPKDLAASLKALGLAPSSLESPHEAARAALDAGGEKKTAHILRDLDDASLAHLRVLLGDTGGVKGAPAGPPPKRRTGAGLDEVHARLSDATRPAEAERARALYRPSKKTPSRSFERFLLHAGRLHDALSGPGLEAMLHDPKAAEDVRKHLFMLEGLVRFYEDRGPKSKMESALADIKALEDALGAFGYACDMKAAGDRIDDLADAARDALAHGVARAQEQLTRLVDDGWRPDGEGRVPRVNDLVDTFARIDFGGPKEDRAFVRERLEDMADKLAGKALDMGDLEGGIHELRRRLRWIPITLIALDGLVALDEDAGGPFAALKDAPVAQTPFARLPAPAGVDQERLTLAWPMFLALSQAIGDLGKIKDRGQVIEGIADALVDAGVPEAQARERAEAHLGDPGGMAAVHEDAARLYQDLKDSGLFDALARAF